MEKRVAERSETMSEQSDGNPKGGEKGKKGGGCTFNILKLCQSSHPFMQKNNNFIIVTVLQYSQAHPGWTNRLLPNLSTGNKHLYKPINTTSCA